MLRSLVRKARQVAGDPVLRQWLLRRLKGGVSGPPPFAAHRPPYLNGMAAGNAESQNAAWTFHGLAAGPPMRPIELPLAGTNVALAPGDEDGVFKRSFDDVETLLALHRFAWVPLATGDGIAASWAQALWDAWRRDFGTPAGGWAWHPYTAAERAINLLDLADKKGLPEPVAETAALLARHANAIFEHLEYFGEHDTSNHLSNNGRGLFRLGLALGIGWAADAGARILIEEAKRILMPSGILREGSSHYHLLIARNYADAWLAARAFKRPEEDALRRIAARMLAVVPRLLLPGGLPLVGDVSPDCPPEYLLGLAGRQGGWLAGLPEEKRSALLALIDETRPVAAEQLAADGWLRFACGPWTGLWHAAPMGWPFMPGHGHQDAGGFELHFGDLPVFVDAGRGAYGETGDAARYRSARVHNTVSVCGADPYPANKPYYDDAFRLALAGPPVVRSGDGEVSLEHGGFRRLEGVGSLRRQWRFTDKRMVLKDELAGRGVHPVARRFFTPLKAEARAGGVTLKGGGRIFHLHSPDAAATVGNATLWRAYGVGRPGTLIEFSGDASLPWSGEIRLEAS